MPAECPSRADVPVPSVMLNPQPMMGGSGMSAQPPVVGRRSVVLQTDVLEGVDDLERSLLVEQRRGHAWMEARMTSFEDVWSAAWRYAPHINVLEARAMLRAMTVGYSFDRPLPPPLRRGGAGGSGVAVRYILTDSKVVCGVVNKGRTSSYRLRGVVRSLAARALGGGVDIRPIWVPTHLNPADGGSRGL